MAVLGLSVNSRVGPNIVWQGNDEYMFCSGSSDMIIAYAWELSRLARGRCQLLDE